MGSVIDYIDCIKCGSEAYNDYNCRTGEEFLICSHCGYIRNFSITNWDRKDEEGWKPEYATEESGGIGAFRVRNKGGVGHQIGSFTDEQGPQEFITYVEENKADLDHADYTQIVNGVVVKTVLIQGDIEKAYDEGVA